MNITLHQLQIFLKIVENKSITKTAEALFLTQPAVSIQLSKLQQQFSIPITETIGKKIHITSFGYKLSEHIQNILNEFEIIQYLGQEENELLKGKIKIAVVTTAKYVIPYFLKEFSEKYPNIEIELDVNNRNKVVKQLEKNEIDIALVSLMPENLGLHKIELMQNKLFLIGSKKSKISKIKNTNELKDLKFIYRENGSATRIKMEHFLQKHDINPSKKIELTTNEAVKQAVIADLGYSILPLIGIKNELKNNELKIIDCKELNITSQWNIIWLKEKRLSPALMSFINLLEEQKESIIKEHFSWIKKYL